MSILGLIESIRDDGSSDESENEIGREGRARREGRAEREKRAEREGKARREGEEGGDYGDILADDNDRIDYADNDHYDHDYRWDDGSFQVQGLGSDDDDEDGNLNHDNS